METPPHSTPDAPAKGTPAAEGSTYIDASREAGRRFMSRGIEGSVVMLNLLRFRVTADYSATPDLAPPTPLSGREAYERYMKHTLPYLREAGGEVVFMGDGGPYLIGPPDEHWDVAMLVRHRSVEAFMAFASNEGYLAGAGHRTAALSDSRLLPLASRSSTAGVEPLDATSERNERR